MHVYLKADKHIFKLTGLKEKESLARLEYLDDLSKLNILFRCNLISINHHKPKNFYFIIDIELSICFHLLTIDENLLKDEVEYLLQPLYQKIICFILCCKRNKYLPRLPKDVYRIIARKMYNSRYI
jgi:hypothetical protein